MRFFFITKINNKCYNLNKKKIISVKKSKLDGIKGM